MLNKIPDTEHNNTEEFEKHFGDSLVEYLKEKRYNNVPVRGENKKKKKLKVTPGKSVVGSFCHNSDSESSDISLPVSTLSADEERVLEPEDTDEVEYINKDLHLLTSNTFVLVKIKSGKRNTVWYRYVAVIKEKIGDNEYKMVGLKCIDTTKQTFKKIENDEFEASANDILAILPYPEVQGSRDRVRYFFKHCVDVFEQ